ncbi:MULTISPECIES: hypothetical protein [unclassified Pseudomonas]|nr:MULTISPECIES: hypothetical protein [unclassified Pseudomonas]
MAAPFVFLYPIIHGFKKAGCVPIPLTDMQVIDVKGKELRG